MKRYEGNGIKISTYKRGGYYIIRVMTYKAWYTATKHRRKAHIEEGWSTPYERKFENMQTANNYFKEIKRNHSDIKMISNEPNKYISYDGKVKEY